MTVDGKTKWMAAYLYYNEPWETFLVEAVEPYVRTVMKNEIAEQFFFIRYWERGPHIRLRFKAETQIITEILQPNLIEHFQTYFESKPSNRTEPNYPESFPDQFKWVANNSIQFVDYLPEYDRYSGFKGMEVAEKQFMISSQVVLHYLRSKKATWTYDEALGTAIKLHLSFASALGLRGEDMYNFFKFYFQNWLPSSFRYLDKNVNPEDLDRMAVETVSSFVELFESQKEGLVSFHKTLLDALAEGMAFEEEILNYWIMGHQQLKSELDLYYENGLLKKRPDNLKSFYHKANGLTSRQKTIWQIYADLIHMTNNRLGIHNKDEGYISFIILKSLEQLGGYLPKNLVKTSADF